MPRYRVEVRCETATYEDVVVWAENEDEAERRAEERAADDADFIGWDSVRALSVEEIEPEPADPECPEDKRMRALGFAELPGL